VAFRPNWYEGDDRRGFWSRSPATWSGVRWIVTLTLGVFLLQFAESELLRSARLTEWGALRAWFPPTPAEAVAGATHGAFNWFFPVQLCTYALLHASLMGHLFWNLLFLFFFGPELEAEMGRRRFLQMYAGGAAAGGLLQWLWYLTHGPAPSSAPRARSSR
jgi:membrane associated rhomboid family serine protease